MSVEFDSVRMEKLNQLQQDNINAYPDRFEPTHSLVEVAGLEEGTPGVAICGRLIAFRDIGNLAFGRLQDVDGQFQIMFEKKTIGPDCLKWIKKFIDVGDHLGVRGKIFRTKRGELSVMADEVELLSKGLLPLPEKWHGLQQIELCQRKRYLDLIANAETRERFQKCIRSTRALRRFLEDNGFVETYTPAISPVASGALATPFAAHHNALDIDVFFRIAPETYLKRLLVGGFTRVYEFARCFRNEGISPQHIQDFVMVEAYAAYWNFRDNMRFTRDMIIAAVKAATGGEARIAFQGQEYDLEAEWPEKTFREVIREACGIDIDDHDTAAGLLDAIKSARIDLETDEPEKLGRGNLVDLLYKRTARPGIVAPTFLIEHPADVSPLAKCNEERPGVVDRYQIIMNGIELVNGYSELSDPVDQQERFVQQQALREGGDAEAMAPEFDFVEALGYGMPPASGWGMSIERFHMLLCDVDNIRDVVFFPLLRPEGFEGAADATADAAADADATADTDADASPGVASEDDS